MPIPPRFADPIPALKRQLAGELVTRLEGWTLEYAADFLRTDIPRVSNLRNGRFERFSLQRLIRFVARTRGTVTMTVAWTPHFLYLPRPEAEAPRTGPHDDIVLTPGQRLQLAGTNAPTLDAPPIEVVTAWRRGEVMLHDTPLHEAVDEMNRYHRTAIVIDDPQIGTYQVSGLYHAGDNEGFARSVARMYDLKVVTVDGRIHLGK